MARKFPQFKKRLMDFVADEKGTISKKNLLKTAVTVGSVAIAAAAVTGHHVSFYVHANTVSSSTSTAATMSAVHSHATTLIQGC